jgi:O-methyltransferase
VNPVIKALIKKPYLAFVKRLAKRNLHIAESLIYCPIEWQFELHARDFNRFASLQLVAQEIERRNIPGHVAEVGVFQGSFAAYINAMFPTRKLYLFDTFEGFDSRDVADDRKRKLSDGSQDFSQTSVDLVMGAMPHPAVCIPKKGYFPESAVGLESEVYAFVSLDTDLYAPIYAGLEYFYPRLSHGGSIFVHDFNNAGYPGTKAAVVDFCDKHQIGFALLPDGGGTAVVSK